MLDYKKKISMQKFKNKINFLNKKGLQVRPIWKPNHLQIYLKIIRDIK